MKIIIPKEYQTIDLVTETDPNLFGEALRNYCFVGNCMTTGCYSTFNLISHLQKVVDGKIYEEAKSIICPEFPESLHVYHYTLSEMDCLIEGYKFCDPYELVCAWYWDGDGTLYFRFNNRNVINTDCKCDYTWAWIYEN